MPNPENLIGKGNRFSSDNQPNNVGRKKNIFKEIQSNFELSIDDMRQVIQDILSMSIDEIKQLKDNKNEPAFRLAIASAIFQCIKSGNWTQINYMFDRLFGKPVEHKEIKVDEFLDIKDLKKILDESRHNRDSEKDSC